MSNPNTAENMQPTARPLKTLEVFGSNSNATLLRAYLHHIQENKLPVSIFLVNGIKLDLTVMHYSDDSIMSVRYYDKDVAPKPSEMTFVQLANISTISPNGGISSAKLSDKFLANVKEYFESNETVVSSLLQSMLYSMYSNGIACQAYLQKGGEKIHKILAFDDYVFLTESEDGNHQLHWFQAYSTFSPSEYSVEQFDQMVADGSFKNKHSRNRY